MAKKTEATETFEAEALPVVAEAPKPQTSPDEALATASAEWKEEANKLAKQYNDKKITFEDYSSALNRHRNKAHRARAKAEKAVATNEEAKKAEAASGNQS